MIGYFQILNSISFTQAKILFNEAAGFLILFSRKINKHHHLLIYLDLFDKFFFV